MSQTVCPPTYNQYGDIRERDYPVNMITALPLGLEFQHSRDVLLAKRKDLKSQGKGHKVKREEATGRYSLDSLYDFTFTFRIPTSNESKTKT
jgi:hypothetical protein